MGLTLNAGCGDDLHGNVRVDLKPKAKGTNVVADLLNLPFRDGCFSSVLSRSVLEHLRCPFDGLSELKRVMHAHARALLEVPNVWNYRRILRTMLDWNYPISPLTLHFQGWDAKVFRFLLMHVGGFDVKLIFWMHHDRTLHGPLAMFRGTHMRVIVRRTANEG